MGNQCKDMDLHVNAFVDLDGVPYVLSEYLDRNSFREVDRSLIRSEVNVDQSESMRAIIDISIDDIGKRGSDGLPAVIGNNTKQKNLLNMIMCGACHNNQLKVLKRGIVMRVNYDVRNARTHQVMRSMVEDLIIKDRLYFLDVNPRNVDDNAIITNFSSSLVSTINEFTHGRDRMELTITNVQMLYQYIKPSPKMPRIKQSLTSCGHGLDVNPYDPHMNQYMYHDQMQHHHVIGTPGSGNYGHEDTSMISPDPWVGFNRFYHFDHHGHDIVFHDQEINDPMTELVLVPCGTVRVNRTFRINPGHKLIFKFSVWKNDLTVVSDTAEIAHALHAPSMDYYERPGCYPDNRRPGHNPDSNDRALDIILRQMDDVTKTIREIDHAVINITRNQERYDRILQKIVRSVKDLEKTVEGYHTPEEEPPVVEPENPSECGCDHESINQKLDEIENELNGLKDDSCECGEEMTLDELEEMFDSIKNN